MVLLSFIKWDIYKTLLNENKCNYKKIFGIFNNFKGRNQDLPLPTCSSNKELANDFNTFFTDKIQKIRMDLNCFKIQQGLTDIPATPPEMSYLPDNLAVRQFRQVSIEERTRYVMKLASNKHITMTGFFPKDLKEALLRPLLKKPHLTSWSKRTSDQSLT